MVVLSNDFALPVTAAFMEGPPGTPASTEELFTIPLGPAVALFLLLSVIAHFVVAGPGWPYGRWSPGGSNGHLLAELRRRGDERPRSKPVRGRV